MIEAYLAILNFVLLGALVTVTISASRLHKEHIILKKFAAIVLTYTEEATKQSTEELRDSINKYVRSKEAD